LEFAAELWPTLQLNAIPVVSFYADMRDFLVIAKVAERDKRGFCLRLSSDAYAGATGEEIDAILNQTNLAPEDIDLVFDARCVDHDKVSLLASATRAAINEFPFIDRWRSLTLLGSAFPIDLSSIPVDTHSHLPRSDWDTWQVLQKTDKPLLRKPAYGDYAVAHPDLAASDPRFTKPSAQLRYALPDSWLVYRGRNVRDYGNEQFHGICQHLVSRPEYRGTAFSPGDAEISDCATHRKGPGTPQAWRRIATSHHLAVVLEQIASLDAV
jgi:hypothetical protein